MDFIMTKVRKPIVTLDDKVDEIIDALSDSYWAWINSYDEFYHLIRVDDYKYNLIEYPLDKLTTFKVECGKLVTTNPDGHSNILTVRGFNGILAGTPQRICGRCLRMITQNTTSYPFNYSLNKEGVKPYYRWRRKNET